MKHLFLILALFTSLTAHCQDVLVTNDGESLKVYNMEIGPSAIFYQLSDAANAEIKRIAKTDVLIIRKADGTKIDPNAETVLQGTSLNSNANASVVNPKLVEDNLALVKEFNNHDVVYLADDTDKKASNVICTLGIKDGSIIETPELKAIFSMKKKYLAYTFSSGRVKHSRIAEIHEESKFGEDSNLDMMVVTLKNKTNKTVFVDLGNSFVITSVVSR